MRALLVGDNDMMNAQVRDSIVRSGFECRSTDILPVKSAAECAGRVCRDLIVLVMSSDPQRYLSVLRELRSTTHAAVLAIGPANNPKFILGVLREGADEYLDKEDLGQLEPTLVRLKIKRMPQKDGGAVIGLFTRYHFTRRKRRCPHCRGTGTKANIQTPTFSMGDIRPCPVCHGHGVLSDDD